MKRPLLYSRESPNRRNQYTVEKKKKKKHAWNATRLELNSKGRGGEGQSICSLSDRAATSLLWATLSNCRCQASIHFQRARRKYAWPADWTKQFPPFAKESSNVQPWCSQATLVRKFSESRRPSVGENAFPSLAAGYDHQQGSEKSSTQFETEAKCSYGTTKKNFCRH